MSSSTLPTPWSSPALTVTDTEGSFLDGRNRLVVLDTHTGSLSARPAEPEHTEGKSFVVGDISCQLHDLQKASRCLAVMVAAWPANPDDPSVSALLRKLAVPAERLLHVLAPVAGTAEWDWTVEAARAYAAMRSIALNPHLYTEDDLGRDYHGQGYVSVDQVIERWPDWPQDEWLAMSDDQLAQVAAGRLWVPPTPHEQREEYEAYWGWSWNLPMYIVGARLGLRAWRDRTLKQATGHDPYRADEWFAEHPPTLSADTGDQQLDQLAVQATARAARSRKVTLIAPGEYLRARRSHLRVQVRDELRQLGLDTERALKESRRLVEARAGQVLRIVAWHDPEDYRGEELRDSDLARLASMTRQGVAYLRTKVEQDASLTPSS